MKAKDLQSLSDRDLIAALRVIRDAISGSEVDYGLIAGDTIALTTNIDNFETSVDTLDTKKAEVAAAFGDRDNLRGVMNAGAGIQIKQIRLHVGNDPAKLGAAGLDVYDTTSSASPTPSSAPLALIDYDILKHIIKFRDAATPDKRANPPVCSARKFGQRSAARRLSQTAIFRW